MVLIPHPSPRKTRRRQRPGARKRHALAADVAEGMSLAFDNSFILPSGAPHQSTPRQHHSNSHANHYERNWKAWKAREAETRATLITQERIKEIERQEAEEHQRLFGGESNDDTPGVLAVNTRCFRHNLRPRCYRRPRRPALRNRRTRTRITLKRKQELVTTSLSSVVQPLPIPRLVTSFILPFRFSSATSLPKPAPTDSLLPNTIPTTVVPPTILTN